MLFRYPIKALSVLLIVAWLSILLSQQQPLLLLQNYSSFAFLGVLGAIFANATGAGGGVVFMPFFNQLGFSFTTSLATSFAIQCCGMTAGAITWWCYFKSLKQHQPIQAKQWQALPKVLVLTVPFSLLGLGIVQWLPAVFNLLSEANHLHIGFGVFSIFLALAIIASVLFLVENKLKYQPSGMENFALILTALIGGGITAWLSIGVGELVAVLLIIRQFNVTFAIAVAVILSACTVWAGVIFHLFVSQAVYWPVVLFAGVGAVLGGILAKKLVLYFCPRQLKLFFAGWIFLLGLSALPL